MAGIDRSRSVGVQGIFQEWGLGRLIIIRVGSWRGDPEAAIYVVAEADPTKAIDIIKVGGTADDGDDFEDLGRVSDTLLSALSLQPGQFTRT
jgi:hypothetical protein